MLWNMRAVSMICNVWTIVLVAIVILKLGREILNAKKNRDKKKRMLYLSSILFVSLLLAYVIDRNSYLDFLFSIN